MFHVVEGTGGLGVDELSGDDGDHDDDLGDDEDQASAYLAPALIAAESHEQSDRDRGQ